MKKYLILLILSIFLIGCGSTKVKMLNGKEAQPLPDDTPITVYSKKEPSFRYKKVCSITIGRKGSFVSTDLDSYRDKVEKEARKCGTKYALIQSLSGFSLGSGKNINVYAYGIKKLSNPDSLEKTDIKKLINAAQLDNTKVLYSILKKRKTSKDNRKRSALDQRVLSLALAKTANKNGCSTQTMNFLLEKFDVKLIDEKELDDFTLRDTFYCPKIIKKSFDGFKDKERLFRAFNNHFVSNPNKGQELSMLLPMFIKESKKDCRTDESGEICMFLPRLRKFKETL